MTAAFGDTVSLGRLAAPDALHVGIKSIYDLVRRAAQHDEVVLEPREQPATLLVGDPPESMLALDDVRGLQQVVQRPPNRLR